MEIYSNQVDEATRIMKEVAMWGEIRAFAYWDEWLTKGELITIDAQPENFYIGKMDGVAVCAFILHWKDSEYWADAKNEAAHLHNIAYACEFLSS